MTPILLAAGEGRAVVAPADGGRIAAWHVGGRQLLRQQAPDLEPEEWGCYPMVPWAGRVRDAAFVWRQQTVRLPHPVERHALHGIAHRLPWQVTDVTADRVRLSLDLPRAMHVPGWPFGGQVTQEITVGPRTVDMRMTVMAADEMPVTVGWHPWFVRRLLGGGDAEVRLEATRMLQRGTDGLPLHRWTVPTAGPWDDCFDGLRRPPEVVWPGIGHVTIRSDLACVVIFDQHAEGVCVEPQSAAPDAVNGPAPQVLPAGESFACQMTMEWADAPI